MEKIVVVNRTKRIPRAKSERERAVWERHGLVCGVDEVGRGCLAGPVVTAAVVLHPGATQALLKDSKALTAPQRERAACWIKEHSWYAYGVASHAEIDRYNIYQATICAMKRAVRHVSTLVPSVFEQIIVDAVPLIFTEEVFASVQVEHFPFAEQQSISVAAASIIAKVKRDELMGVFEKLFPGYLLAQHKGYATSVHRRSIEQNGASIIHRDTFLGAIRAPKEQHERAEQIELFCRDCPELVDTY